MPVRCLAVLAFSFMANLPMRATEAKPGNVAVLQARVEQLVRSFPGKVGVFARHVESGQQVAYNGDDPFPMASTYKIAIMVEVFREGDAGRLSLDERVAMKDTDHRLGSGLPTWMKPGLNPTIYDLVLLMISVSDNEATDILLHRVGAANVTATLRQLGITDMRVDRTTQEIVRDWIGYVDPASGRKPVSDLLAPVSEVLAHLFQNTQREKIEEANREFTSDPRDHASPHAMTELVTKIVLGQAASQQSCQAMLDIMKQQQFIGRIPRYLENLTIAGKNATLRYTTNDVGVDIRGEATYRLDDLYSQTELLGYHGRSRGSHWALGPRHLRLFSRCGCSTSDRFFAAGSRARTMVIRTALALFSITLVAVCVGLD